MSDGSDAVLILIKLLQIRAEQSKLGQKSKIS